MYTTSTNTICQHGQKGLCPRCYELHTGTQVASIAQTSLDQIRGIVADEIKKALNIKEKNND